MLPPRSSRYGSVSRHMRNGPVRLTRRMKSHSSRVASTLCRKRPTPATLQTMSGAPRAATVSATAACTEASSPTSHRADHASPPASQIAAAVFSAPSPSMSRHATAPPSSPRRTQTARPRPDAAPVTMAVLPSNLRAWGGTRSDAMSGPVGRVARGQVDRLLLEEQLETVGPELASNAGLLVATERGPDVDGEAVDGVRARAHPTGDVEAAVDVGGPHRARQPVVRVVGDGDGVVGVAVGDDGMDGPEVRLMCGLSLV